MGALPIETMRAILEIAIDKEGSTYAELLLGDAPLSKYREQQALIRKLGSVCHRWRSICLEFLFEHVWIGPPLEPNTLAFRQIFDTNTLCGYSRHPPGWWTRQLYLDIHFLEPSERKALVDHFQVNNPFPNVECLFIFDCGSDVDAENAKVILYVYAEHLASLMLKGSVDTLRSMISCAPGGLPHLRELALEFPWSGPPSPDKRDPLVLPSVNTLHLSNIKYDEYFGLLDWSFPSLRTLAMYMTYMLPDAFGPFIHLHGSTITSLSIPYWPLQPSVHKDLFEACRALERLEVLEGMWVDDETLELVSLTHLPIMEEHGLREWTFKQFWVEAECFDITFQDCAGNPNLFPSLQKIRLLSPGVDKLFSLPLSRVHAFRNWSRALKDRGVALVDDENGIPFNQLRRYGF